MTYGYLEHHGVKGQKWGVRRYQNPDGSLTELGRQHYGVGERVTKKVVDSMSPEQKRKVSAGIDKVKNIDQEKLKKVATTAAVVGLVGAVVATLAGVAIGGGIAIYENPEAVGEALKSIGGVAVSALKGVGEFALNAAANAGGLKEAAKDFIQEKIKSPLADKAMSGEGPFNTLSKMAKGVNKYGTSEQKEKFVIDRLTDLRGNRQAFGTMSNTILNLTNKGQIPEGILGKTNTNFEAVKKLKVGAKEAAAAGTVFGLTAAGIKTVSQPIIKLVNEVSQVKNAYDSPGSKWIRQEGKSIIEKMKKEEKEK